MRFLRLAFVALALVVADGNVWGNGRPAATTSILVNPGSDQQLLAGATFGALFTFDSGASWQLVCEAPLGTSGAAIDPVYRLTSGGVLLQATPNGLQYSTNGGCDWTQAGGSIAGKSTSDIAVSPSDPMRVLAASSVVAAQNGVHVSMDGGRSFMAPAQTATGAFKGVRFAGGNRVYAVSYDNTGATLTTAFWKSDNAGASFSQVATQTGEGPPVLIGADPRDPNKVYYFARINGSGTLKRSTDGGATWNAVFTTSTIFAAVFADNGTLYVSANDGVHKSTDGMNVGPAPANAKVVQCLAIRGTTLFGCGIEFSVGFSIGKSTDDGATWTALLHLNQNITGPLQCANSTQECTQCYPMWSSFATMFGLPNTTTPACMANPSPWGGGAAGTGGSSGGTGGSSGSGSGGSGGCSCAVGATAPALGALGLILVGVVVIWRRRR